MTCSPGKTLKANPFQTYRDPETGQWKVVMASADSSPSSGSQHAAASSQAPEKLRHTDG